MRCMVEKVVEIKNLHYAYPDGTKALSGLDLDVFRGETLGIIGANGAGKSTLLLHLNGILRNGASEAVKVLGRDMTDKNIPFIRSRVGLVFQDPENQLFMPTVFDDVAFGPINMGMKEGDVRRAVEEALKEVDLPGFAGRSPHHLSVGEKKRAAIATVLSMKPDILVLDEPSSNLDPKHRRGLIDLLRRLPLTMIIATHDLPLLAETCSRICVMEEGRVEADGKTADILQNYPLLEDYDTGVLLHISRRSTT